MKSLMEKSAAIRGRKRKRHQGVLMGPASRTSKTRTTSPSRVIGRMSDRALNETSTAKASILNTLLPGGKLDINYAQDKKKPRRSGGGGGGDPMQTQVRGQSPTLFTKKNMGIGAGLATAGIGMGLAYKKYRNQKQREEAQYELG